MPSSFPPLAAAAAVKRAAHSTVLPSFLLFLVVVVVVLLASFLLQTSPTPSLTSTTQYKDHQRYRYYHQLFLSSSTNSATAISSHLRHLTSHPHLAGTPSSIPTSDYVLSHLRSSGIPSTSTLDLHPLLSFPLHSSLSLHLDQSPPHPLPLSDLHSSHLPPSSPPFHAYSPSGSLVASPVYVNLAGEPDFLALSNLGVSISGNLVLARRGPGSRSAAISRAASHGASALLMFKPDSSASNDENTGNGGVERGTVLVGGPGDPLTPGWAAVAGAERLAAEDDRVRSRFPAIPSLPIPASAAEEILRTLGGPPMPDTWRAGLPSDVTRGVGPGPVLVNFTFKEEKKLATIRNVFGVIEGREESDRYVILGNHRDAWTYGAVDPNSGTAVLLDVARRLGVLLRAGWRPRRTIILCSWDAEEFGMIGSTEWVEQNIANLGLKAVAYLNVDCAVQGPDFFASATPQLDKLLLDITKKVKDPDFEEMSVFQAWEATKEGIQIGRLSRMDSDFTAFLHHAGIPAIDMYFGKDYPVYHTAFDSYDWMEKHGDPLFHRHVAVAEIWGLLALSLADSPVLPFDYGSYAAQLQEHVSAASDLFENQTMHILNASIDEFATAAREVQAEAQKLIDGTGDGHTDQRRRSLNDRLVHAERGFLEPEGLKGRPWFKHTIYSPSEDDESETDAFPGIVDSIYRSKKMANGERKQADCHEMWRISRAIQRAAQILRGLF